MTTTTGARRLITFADRDEPNGSRANAQNLATRKMVALELSPAERGGHGRTTSFCAQLEFRWKSPPRPLPRRPPSWGTSLAVMIEAARHFSRRAAITKTSIGDAVSELIAFKSPRSMSLVVGPTSLSPETVFGRLPPSFTGDLGDLTTP